MPAGVGYPGFIGAGERPMLPIDYLRRVRGDGGVGVGLPAGESAPAGSLAEILTAADGGIRRRPSQPVQVSPGGPRPRPSVPIGTGAGFGSSPSNPYLTQKLQPGAGAGWADPGGAIPLPDGGQITMPEGGLSQAEIDVLSGIRAGTRVAPGNEQIVMDLMNRGVLSAPQPGANRGPAIGVNGSGGGVSPGGWSRVVDRGDGTGFATGPARLADDWQAPPSVGVGGGPNSVSAIYRTPRGYGDGDFMTALRGGADVPLRNDTMQPDQVAAGGGQSSTRPPRKVTSTPQPVPGGPQIGAPRLPSPPRRVTSEPVPVPRPRKRTAPAGSMPAGRTPPPLSDPRRATAIPLGREAAVAADRKRADERRGFDRQMMPSRRSGQTGRLMGNR